MTDAKKLLVPLGIALAGAGLIGAGIYYSQKKATEARNAELPVMPGSGEDKPLLPPLKGRLLPAKGGQIVIATLNSLKPVVDEMAKALPDHTVTAIFHDEEELAGLLPLYAKAPKGNVFVLLDGFIDSFPETAVLAAQAMLLAPRGNAMRLAVMPEAFGDLKTKQMAWWDKLPNCTTPPCMGRIDLTEPSKLDWKDSEPATIAAIAAAMGRHLAEKLLNEPVLG